MGGTLGSIRKKQKQLEEQRKRMENSAKFHSELQLNREEVIAEICKLFGWSRLDDFAQKMIDDAFMKKVVDIEQLKADIAAWKKEQDKESADIIMEQQEQE